MPILFLSCLTLVGNFYEKSSASSLADERVYGFNQIEVFISSVGQYTPEITEEPSLTASVLAFDREVSYEDFLEKPLITETISKPTLAKAAEQRKEIISYQVKNSDTVSKIAAQFGISVRAIADANNLFSVDSIKSGQSLLIPPADGVIHIAVSGDTLSSLVKKYQGDLSATLQYNGEDIKIGQRVLIAGGKKPTAVPSAPTTTRIASSRNVVTRSSLASSSSSGRSLGGAGSRSNGYSWGWCTWYAAYRRNIPRNWGNAGQWLGSAQRSGYRTGSAPAPGAIIVTRESWWGHVGYVEEVNGNTVVISEMNYSGWGVVSRRSVSENSSFIKGYIY